MPKKLYLPSEDNRCYIGIDANGAICAWRTINPARPEIDAVDVASWIMQGLTVSIADTAVVGPIIGRGEVEEVDHSYVVAVYTERNGTVLHVVEEDDCGLLDSLEDEHGIRLHPKY